MQLKGLLLSAFALISLSATAQDKIYKRNGDVMDVKVKEVNTRNISYKKADNPDGPDYVINRADVEKIRYNNGSEDYMDDRRMRPGPGGNNDSRPSRNIDWGNNIMSLAPINIGDEGFGVGIAYERSLDENGYISFYLPVNMVFGAPNDANRFSSSGVSYTRSRSIVQIMPGIKFYPTGNKGKVRYAVGPQLSYETGTKTEEQTNPIIDPNNPNSYWQIGDAKVQKFGIMVNNSLNMSPNGKIYIGLDLGLGLTYINKMENLFTGQMREQGTRQLAQFNFRIGYRF